MREIIRGSIKVFLLFIIIIMSSTGCNTIDSANAKSDNINEFLLEKEEDGIVKITYYLLNGEDRVEFNVVPGVDYNLEYELRSDDGVFDIRIISEGNNLIYKVPLFDELINNHRNEMEQNAHLHIIGGAVKLNSTDEKIIVVIKGTSAVGYLKLNLK